MKKFLVITSVVIVAIGVWIGLRPSKAQLESAKFMLFHGNTFEEHDVFEFHAALDLLNHPKFDNNKKTVVYCHGYIETPEVESIHVIVDAYLKNQDYNIIILDWSNLAEGSFLLEAVPNCKKLGISLGNLLIQLFDAGLDINKFHLVGHSLGGQLAGFAGRTVYQNSDKKIKLKRISALDPAFPPFYPGIFIAHLSEKDAEFVDVIHTDAGLYGAPVSTGTVDFWPNSGKTLQPGCPKRNYIPLTDIDLCSHRRSWRFWAESVGEKNQANFHAVKCKNWSNFKSGNFENSLPVAQMGMHCQQGIKGDYYLQTNGEFPYSKGMDGITFEQLKK